MPSSGESRALRRNLDNEVVTARALVIEHQLRVDGVGQVNPTRQGQHRIFGGHVGVVRHQTIDTIGSVIGAAGNHMPRAAYPVGDPVVEVVEERKTNRNRRLFGDTYVIEVPAVGLFAAPAVEPELDGDAGLSDPPGKVDRFRLPRVLCPVDYVSRSPRHIHRSATAAADGVSVPEPQHRPLREA